MWHLLNPCVGYSLLIISICTQLGIFFFFYILVIKAESHELLVDIIINVWIDGHMVQRSALPIFSFVNLQNLLSKCFTNVVSFQLASTTPQQLTLILSPTFIIC
jgi:hypothetical protein